MEITPLYGTDSLTGIQNGSASLTAGTDYTVSGGKIVIAAGYLAAQQDGVNRLKLSFAGGASRPSPSRCPVRRSRP